MSIEKLSSESKVYVEKSPYVQVLNIIAEKIKDNDAFRIYVFLFSKSRDWKVMKEYTSKICLTGERKAKQCWSYLERCGLIEYVQVRGENGKFGKHDMMVLNGSKFDPDVPFLNPKKAASAETAPPAKLSTDEQKNNKKTGGAIAARAVSAPLLKKEETNKEKNNSKSRLSLVKNEKAKPFPEDPLEVVSDRAIEIAQSKGLDYRQVLAGFHEYCLKNNWHMPNWQVAFEKWVENERVPKIRNELRSTVKEWGPGHPDYDRLHEYN